MIDAPASAPDPRSCAFAADCPSSPGTTCWLYSIEFLLRQQAIMRSSQYWLPVDFGTWASKLAMELICVAIAAALFSL